MKTIFIPTFILSLCFPVLGYAASFDCRKSSTYIEKLICNDHFLSELNDQMNSVYKKALDKALIKEDFKYQQKLWLREHRDTCRDVDCLKYEYKNRIEWLNETIAIEIPKNTVNGEYIWIRNALNSLADPLSKPDDKNICQDFLKNLNSFRAPTPNICETKLNLDISGFTPISWKPINAAGNENLIIEVARARLKYNPGAEKELLDKNYIDKILSIYKEELYLDYTVLKSSDGTAYSLIRSNALIKQGCTNVTHLYQESSYFYSPIDFSKLNGVFENIPLEKLFSGLRGEVIIYNNNIYFISAEASSRPIGEDIKKTTDYHLSQLRINAERDNYTGDEVCRYQFIWPTK